MMPKVTHKVLRVASRIAAMPSQEGEYAAPEGQLIANIQKFLSAKYALEMAYRSYSDRIKGPWRDAVVEHWQEHAGDERKHTYSLAMKVVGIGGDPIQTYIQIPVCTPNVGAFIQVLMSMELEAIASGRELAKLAGENTGLKVLAENIVELDTHHLDDLIRMSGEHKLI